VFTFPIRTARLVHVHVSVDEAWGHNEVPIVQDLSQPSQKEGCVGKIGPGCIPIDGLHRSDEAILDLHCTHSIQDVYFTIPFCSRKTCRTFLKPKCEDKQEQEAPYAFRSN
jgi:hypothetical protein